MRRRRYDQGGLTEADIAAGLTQADIDAGLRAGRNERISDEDRQAALRSAGMAQSFPVAEPAPRMRQGLSDLEAANLMGREVRQPAPIRNVPSPRSSKASTLAFEANYPVEQPPYQAFEENYPGPRQVKVPTRKGFGNMPNVGPVGTESNRPYGEDAAMSFTRRVGRAEANAPLARGMIDNPAKARLMRAISDASGRKHAADRLAAELVAQQVRSDFDYPRNEGEDYKKGGRVKKKMAKGGSVKSSASRRGDGIAQRGKTKGRMV